MLHHVESKLLKDAIVTVLIGCCQRRLGDRLSPQTEVEALGLMSFKCHYQVSQALTVAELPEHQSKKLVPAGEMLDITVPIVLVNKTTELVIVQKLYQLGEYIFVFVHLAVNLFGRKITNSNRRA